MQAEGKFLAACSHKPSAPESVSAAPCPFAVLGQRPGGPSGAQRMKAVRREDPEPQLLCQLSIHTHRSQSHPMSLLTCSVSRQSLDPGATAFSNDLPLAQLSSSPSPTAIMKQRPLSERPPRGCAPAGIRPLSGPTQISYFKNSFSTFSKNFH